MLRARQGNMWWFLGTYRSWYLMSLFFSYVWSLVPDWDSSISGQWKNVQWGGSLTDHQDLYLVQSLESLRFSEQQRGCVRWSKTCGLKSLWSTDWFVQYIKDNNSRYSTETNSRYNQVTNQPFEIHKQNINNHEPWLLHAPNQRLQLQLLSHLRPVHQPLPPSLSSQNRIRPCRVRNRLVLGYARGSVLGLLPTVRNRRSSEEKTQRHLLLRVFKLRIGYSSW